MDPAAVERAIRKLDPAGIERVAYTCQLSGKEYEVLLVGDQLALRLADTLPEAEDADGARILPKRREREKLVPNTYEALLESIGHHSMLRGG